LRWMSSHKIGRQRPNSVASSAPKGQSLRGTRGWAEDERGGGSVQAIHKRGGAPLRQAGRTQHIKHWQIAGGGGALLWRLRDS